MEILGIDIGGSGIKGAIIETSTGELTTERHRIPTPKPATPEAMSQTVKELIEHFDWKGAVGCSFPTVVINGQCRTSGNISPKWVGVQIDNLFSETCGGLDFFIANDADLAGIAEMTLGAGKDRQGLVMMLTAGTGIGSGMFYNGKLIPNMELGRVLHTDGKIIELYAADSARKREDLKLSEWAKRFDFFLNHIVKICSPEFFILGGGISKKFDKFKEHFTIEVPIVQAKFKNNAGIIGAAMYAERNLPKNDNT